MVSEKKCSPGYSMLGFLAVSLFILMLMLTVVEYSDWVYGETLVTDLIDSDASRYLFIGGAAGGLLLAFSAIGRFEKGRPGRIGEGLFLVLVGIFIVWAAIFGMGDEIFDISIKLATLSFFLAVICSIYDDFEDNRRMLFGSLSIIFLISTLAMILVCEPGIYQIWFLILGSAWLLLRGVRALCA
ncbi:MAG: hypothetical protein ACOX1N_02765 [Candidatus Methanomethylophilaceae archaeon]|jgi:hypothetical protein